MLTHLHWWRCRVCFLHRRHWWNNLASPRFLMRHTLGFLCMSWAQCTATALHSQMCPPQPWRKQQTGTLKWHLWAHWCKEGKIAYFHVTPSCHSTQSYTGPGSLYFFSRDARSSDWLCSSSFCSFSLWRRLFVRLLSNVEVEKSIKDLSPLSFTSEIGSGWRILTQKEVWL